MRFSDRVKALDLPLDQVVVIGSGLVDQLGFRTADDIDLVVAPQVLATAESSREYECGVQGVDRYCRRDGLELWSNWGEELPYEVLEGAATTIDEVRFASPYVVIGKKRQRAAAKDLQDIAWLEEYYDGSR